MEELERLSKMSSKKHFLACVVLFSCMQYSVTFADITGKAYDFFSVFIH